MDLLGVRLLLIAVGGRGKLGMLIGTYSMMRKEEEKNQLVRRDLGILRCCNFFETHPRFYRVATGENLIHCNFSKESETVF